MDSAFLPTSDTLGHHFLSLPRELRDLIYPYIVTKDDPIYLAATDTQLNIRNATISAELLEAVYTHNTFVVSFSHSVHSQDENASASIWGDQPQYKKYIRNIIVEASEVKLEETELPQLERECTVTRPEVRKEWLELLELPRLERLTINMQKGSSKKFCWANFSPVLYQLRSTLPKLQITFNISFDNLLEFHWYDPVWQSANNPVAIYYHPMSFVDVSELIERPSEDDKQYVELFLTKRNETTSRDAVAGLLALSPEDKRTLGRHYVVKEPALLRVLMEDHWEVYKGVNGLNAEAKELGL
ncbi:Nn.00g114840.m01.CDS01 [Neocucurbitaria sp. VM-36]